MSYGQKPGKKLVCVAGSSLELLWVYFRPTKIKIESWLVHQIFSLTHGAQSARGFGACTQIFKTRQTRNGILKQVSRKQWPSTLISEQSVRRKLCDDSSLNYQFVKTLNLSLSSNAENSFSVLWYNKCVNSISHLQIYHNKFTQMQNVQTDSARVTLIT